MRFATVFLTACALALSACSAGPKVGEETSTSENPPRLGGPTPTSDPVPPEVQGSEFADLVDARNRFHAAFEDYSESETPLAGQIVLRRMQRAWDDFEVALEDAAAAGLDLSGGKLEEDILETTPKWLDSVEAVTRIGLKCDLGPRPSLSAVQACTDRFPELQILLIEMVSLTGLVAQQQERLRDVTPE